MELISYSPYTILWKLPFCISPCTETSPAKCECIICLHSKSRKKCDKNFENRLTKKNFKPKNDLAMYFACTREIILRSLNQNSGKFGGYVQAFGPQLNIFYYVVLVRNVKNENLEILFFSGTPLLTISQWKTP